jgi:hypothetical protein
MEKLVIGLSHVGVHIWCMWVGFNTLFTEIYRDDDDVPAWTEVALLQVHDWLHRTENRHFS